MNYFRILVNGQVDKKGDQSILPIEIYDEQDLHYCFGEICQSYSSESKISLEAYNTKHDMEMRSRRILSLYTV